MSTYKTLRNSYNDESDYKHMHGFKNFIFLHFPNHYLRDFNFV